MKIENHYY